MTCLPLQIFHPEDKDFDMGDVFRNEVWQNPLSIYMSVSDGEWATLAIKLSLIRPNLTV